MIEKRWFFGRKLHLLTMPNGLMLSFRLSSGNVFDSRLFHSLVKDKCKMITGDSAYRAKKPPKGTRTRITKPFAKRKKARNLHGKRVAIERVFGGLKKLGLEKGVILKHPASQGSHILAVLTCLLAIQYLNLQEGLQPMTYGRFLM